MRPIALSGVDGVGKSQQIRLLSRESAMFHVTKPLIQYSERWPKLSGSAMSKWWFEDVSMEEFMDIVVESLEARKKDVASGKIQVFDRSSKMFKAVCVATWATRANLSIDNVLPEVSRRFEKAFDRNDGEFEILLVSDDDYLRSIEKFQSLFRSDSGSYEPYMNERYSRYQANLRQTMKACFAEDGVKRLTVASPIIDVQNSLRELISQAYGIKLSLLADGVSRIVGLGGLSECGKSSFADSLRKSGYYRLKLRYFIEVVEARGETATPENLAAELLHFCQRHYYVKEYSIESLHDPYVPAYLKMLFGNRVKIAYLDAGEDIRIDRAMAEMHVERKTATDAVRAKDQVKLLRGALNVRGIADLVVDNSPNSFEHNFARFSMALNS